MSNEANDAFLANLGNPSALLEPQPRPRPSSNESLRLVSIVVPCCGQVEFTRLCVKSLLRHCRQPYELIFVDVGSVDGTADYLTGVADASPISVDIIRARAETGFRSACTEGLARAGGEFVAWLNNDTIVSNDWLQQLVALCSGHNLIGMVGPMSNYAPVGQRVSPVPYRIGSRMIVQSPANDHAGRNESDIEIVDQFARDWREKHRGEWLETDRLGGFCLLLKREVLQRISFFDEKADQGIFDADALCRQVRQAGYHLACCRDLFIHHFGSRLAAR